VGVKPDSNNKNDRQRSQGDRTKLTNGFYYDSSISILWILWILLISLPLSAVYHLKSKIVLAAFFFPEALRYSTEESKRIIDFPTLFTPSIW
jgi:hypothetical protein